jgi:hypothetical protein
MSKQMWRVFSGLCALAMAAVWAAPGYAQTTEVKEKPPMYSYVGNWNIPRAQWADMEKSNASELKVLEKAWPAAPSSAMATT